MRRLYYNNFSRLISTIFLFFIPLTGVFCQEEFTGWKKTATEHFTFIYEERDSNSVEELISFCEDVYEDVAGYFEYYPENIDCIIRGRIDTANGSYTAFPNRLELYVASPSGPWLGARTENWLKSLLVHELTHYIHLTYNKGFSHVLGEIFGHDLKVVQAGFQPGWMIEGIAVALETEFTGGGRGRNPFFEISWKAPILEDKLFSLRQASYMSAYPPRGRIYVAGWMIVSYMMERFGRDVFKNIHREYVVFPFFGPRYALQRVTGQSAAEIYSGMTASLQRRYEPYRDLPRGDLITPDVTGDYYFPEITSSGWYLYRSTLDKVPGIVRFDPATGREKLLVETSLTDSDSLTADAAGETLYFASMTVDTTGPAGETYTSDIYRLTSKDKRPTQLTRNGHVWHPAVSDDGTVLAAVQRTASYSRLVSIDTETGGITPLFVPFESTIYTPDISPDGSKIVFALNHRGMQDIWIYSFSSGSAAPIMTLDKPGDYYPRFSGNGRILFSSDKEGDIRLYEYSIEERKVREIYRDRIAAYSGTVEGETLYYGSYGSGGWCVRSVPAPGFSTASDLFPEASPGAGDLASTFEAQPGTELHPEPQPRYYDVPRPLAWAPVPAYLNPLNGSFPEDFGIGVFSYWASLLGRSEIYGYISFPFTVFQPSILLESSFRVWRLSFAYSYNQVYMETASDYYQALSQDFSLTVPLLSRYKLGNSAALSLTAGLHHSHAMWRETPFHTFNWFDFSGFRQRQRLYFINGLGVSLGKSGSPAQLLAPFRFRTTLQSSIPLPINEETPEGAAVYHTLELQFRSFFPKQFVRLGASSNFTSPELLGSRSTMPRGTFTPEPQPHRGATLFALDYLFSFGAFDRPLPMGYNMFGLNIQGAALGLHLELITDWDAAVFALDRYIYVGIEWIFDIGASLASIPVGFGISFRFDRHFAAPVSITDDLRPYIFIGLDSFLSTVIGNGPERQGPEGQHMETAPRIAPADLFPMEIRSGGIR